MFLIRTFFWVSLVILLLPIGQSNSSNVMGATKHALSDMDQFCQRNVDICNIGTEAWKSIKYKAAYSFDLAADFAKQVKQANVANYTPVYKAVPKDWETSSINDAAEDVENPLPLKQNTLKKSDLEPAWSFKADT